jgi:hypothetical protein
MKNTFSAVVALLMASTQVFASVPGFQDTVNHYRIGMDDPSGRNVHQWMNVDFISHRDGRIEANIHLENDTWSSFKGSVELVAKDAAGNVLLDVVSPEFAIAGKDVLHGDTPNRVTVPWSFQASPAVGLRGADLFGVRASYQQNYLPDPPFGLTWEQVIQTAQMVVRYIAK